jgi:CRISPR-associated endonuclease/helicase Cas3
MTEEQFRSIFTHLTGNQHFPWQWTLYQRFAEGDIPSPCKLPTGLGKTSVIALWLIALAQRPDKLPRRLVYVVNRRTVVDQTTTEVEKLRENLQNAGLFDSLKQLCAIPLEDDESPLAVSTLRGQFADNREWSADPCRPAVICGTVDMIGSRLLFSGYGVGFKTRPLHAGFLGQDVLLVHDEAHLEPAFQKLIETIQREQHERERVGKLPWHKLQVMALTATSREGDSAENNRFELTPEEKAPQLPIPDPPTEPLHVVWRRLKAPKAIHFIQINEEKKELADKISSLALEKFKNSGQAILIFAQTVENVENIAEKLNKAQQQVQQLTGTMRGLERDALVKKPIFQRFLPPSDRATDVTSASGTVYLVCTSAGEVGVNLSADHLICDLTTFESMTQRFGRVNRFGERTDTEIHVFHPTKFDDKSPYEQRRKKTLELLQQLNGDASPAALAQLDSEARQQAFAPTPTVLPATDILFDAWALTTIREELPGRPAVEPYLHGLSGEGQPPETYVAWREEVNLITGELREQYRPEDLLEDYPLKPHELLRDISSRVFDRLKKLQDRLEKLPAAAQTPVWIWIVADNGSVKVKNLDKLTKAGKEELYWKTVLLPPQAGGLKDGLLDPTSTTADDVADQWFADKAKTIPRRRRFRSDQPQPEFVKGMRLVREIDLRPNADEEETLTEIEESGDSEAPVAGRYWRWYVRPLSADDDASKTAQEPVPWQDHTDQVTAYAKAIAGKLNLPAELQKALELAGRFHDLGKRRELWQRSIGNPNPTDWYAKSGKGWKPQEITSYRHEFGSLFDVQSEPEFQQLDDDMKDLVLHLIAVHHGRGRPHFPPEESFDPTQSPNFCNKIAYEVPRRFARLQRKYGRWGLAYLESLLRAADWAASARPSQQKEDEPITKGP